MRTKWISYMVTKHFGDSNLMQWETAEIMGVTQSYLSYLERGRRNLDLGDAFEICDKLGLDMEVFIRKYIKGEVDEIEIIEDVGDIDDNEDNTEDESIENENIEEA